MAARPRTRNRKDWPRGLHETRPGYFVWENPFTKKSMAIGRVPLANAKQQAIEANLLVYDQLGQTRLVDRLLQQDLTVAQWLEEWRAGLKIAANTARTYKSMGKAIGEQIGTHALARLTVKDVAESLVKIEATRGARTAQACRSIMINAFNAAIAKGHMGSNPAAITESPEVNVQRKRFTWESFSKVWEALQEGPVWLKHAAMLGVILGARREDIASLKFADVVDGYLRLIPAKSKGTVKLEIPIELRLEKLGISLRDAITICRRTGVVSPYMVHQTEPRGNSPPGQQIWVDTISRRFSEYVTLALGADPQNPTFHELRSLCKRLYKVQGGVDTKDLLGHTTEQTAALYNDPRGSEFQRIKLG